MVKTYDDDDGDNDPYANRTVEHPSIAKSSSMNVSKLRKAYLFPYAYLKVLVFVARNHVLIVTANNCHA